MTQCTKLNTVIRAILTHRPHYVLLKIVKFVSTICICIIYSVNRGGEFTQPLSVLWDLWHVSTFGLFALVRLFVSKLADPVEVEDDAAPRDDDDEEGQRVEEDHAQQEVEELGGAAGEGAEGDALPVPGELGVIPGTKLA